MRFRVFVVSSVLLFITTLLAVWIDFDREWKHIQRDFNKLEYNKTQVELDNLKNSMETDPEFKKLVESLKAAEEKVSSPDVQTKQNELNQQIAKLKYDVYKAERDAKFTKSRLDAQEYVIIKLNNEQQNPASAISTRDQMLEIWGKQKEFAAGIRDQYTKAQDELKSLTAEYKDLKTKFDDKNIKVDVLEKKIEAINKRPIEIQNQESCRAKQPGYLHPE